MQTRKLEFTAHSACRTYIEYEGHTNKHEGEQSKSKAIWTLSLPISELPQHLPYGPNARNASLDAKTSKAMLETLGKEPAKFIFYNSGVMIVAKSLKAHRLEGGDFRVEMEIDVPTSEDEGEFLGHGVLNGGHTYKCLMHAKYGNEKHSPKESYPHIDQASVQMSVAVGIDEEEIPKISKARNLSVSVPIYGLKNLSHDWKAIEEALPQEYRKNVVFKPNEDGEFEEKAKYNVTDLVRRLALVNNKLFDFRQDKHPIKTYNSLGSLVQNWKESDYDEVIPLLGDVLWLEEQIMEQHVNVNGKSTTGKKVVISKISGCNANPMKLITGKEIPITIGEIYWMCVLAAFRVLLKNGQWTGNMSREEIWQQWGSRLVDRMWDAYKNEGRSSASVFAKSKSTWSTLTNLVAMQFVKI